MRKEIETKCPSCSPKEEVPHEVLKKGQNPVARCQICGQVHAVKIEVPKPVNLKVIISRTDHSISCKTELDPETVLSVEDEIIVDDEDLGLVCPVLITALEVGEKRVESALAREVGTIWSRAIDELVVKFSAQSGTEKTEVLEKRVPGDYEFTVGEEEKVGNTSLIIQKIKVRDGLFRSKKGDVVLAKYVKRIFASKKGEWADRRVTRRGPW
jgi:uncharacterized Zn finger protein